MPKSKVSTDKLCFLINSFSLTYVEGLQELRSRALEGDVTGVFRRSATARLPRRPVTLTRHREPFHSPEL